MRFIGFLSILGLFPAWAQAEAPAENKVAVMNLKGSEGIPAQLVTSLTALIPQELERMGPFEVITMADVQRMLEHEQMKQQLGCDDLACLVEIGGALGVELLISGSVTMVGDTYLIQLNLLDTREARAEGRVTREYEGGPKGLLEEVRVAAKILMRDILAAASGSLALRVSEEGATIEIDDAIVGVSPVDILTVAGGLHTVSVEKEGFVRFRKDVQIEAEKAAVLEVTLRPSDEFLKHYQARTELNRTLAWTGMIAGATMIITGIVTMTVASGEASALADEIDAFNLNPTFEVEDRLTRWKKDVAALDVVTMVMWGVGAAALGTGLVLYFIGDDPDRYESATSVGVPARVGLRFTPGGLGFVGEF